MDTDSTNSLQTIEANIAKYQGMVAAEDDKMLRYKVCNSILNLATSMITWTRLSLLHTAKNGRIAAKSAAGLLPCSHQVDVRMRSHRLLRLGDNKLAASCQRAKLQILSTSLMQVVTTTCSSADFHGLDTTWPFQHFRCNLMANLHPVGKIHNLHLYTQHQ